MAVQPKRRFIYGPPGKQSKTGGLSTWGLAWRRLRRNRRAMIGLVILVLMGLSALFAPQLAPHDRDLPNTSWAEKPPDGTHWLGTDRLGRDVFSRLLYGGRISMTVGLVAVGLSVAIGVLLGSIAGFYGGLVDNIIMRLTDVVMVIPFIPLALTLASVLGPSYTNTMLVLGLLGWTGICRLVRGEFLALRRREFVEAAEAQGARDSRIIFKHILPNAMAPVLVAATLGMAGAIVGEAGLSYLSLGVQQPTPSWGNMLSETTQYRVMTSQPWLWVPPGMAIFLTVLSVNLLGDGLRDALDPRLKE